MHIMILVEMNLKFQVSVESLLDALHGTHETLDDVLDQCQTPSSLE